MHTRARKCYVILTVYLMALYVLEQSLRGKCHSEDSTAENWSQRWGREQVSWASLDKEIHSNISAYIKWSKRNPHGSTRYSITGLFKSDQIRSESSDAVEKRSSGSFSGMLHIAQQLKSIINNEKRN